MVRKQRWNGGTIYYKAPEVIDRSQVKQLNIPTCNKTEYIYTGEKITITDLNDYNEEFMTVAGNEATDIGNYTITISLKDKRKTQWLDGSTDDITINWKILSYGDVNGDGKVNITDVALINAHVKKTKFLIGEELERADINGDGKVNITDVGLVNAHVKKIKLLF